VWPGNRAAQNAGAAEPFRYEPGVGSQMYAVIFRATINQLDDEYNSKAKIMRDLAFSKYGCIDFVCVTEGDQEIAISYWENEGDIRRWKSDPEHSKAQEQGKVKWYKDYHVQIVKIEREYKNSHDI
jgi:heme-degrading monooxygenase HmoA